MFRLTAIVLAATLCLPAAEIAKPDIRSAALEIPTGANVRIKTITRLSIQGRLTTITSDGVTLQVVEKDRINERTVLFADMKSIKETNKPLSPAKVVLLTLGVLYGIGIIVGLAYGGAG